MAFIRKIKASLVRQDVSEYIGEDTYLFYDIETGCIRQYNGLPGGEPACIEGITGGGISTVQDEGITISAVATLLNFAGAGVTVTEPGVAGEMLVTIPASGGGDPDQNLWETISSDSGSAVANTITDTLTIAGGTGISTAIAGDTLTITATGGAGSDELVAVSANDTTPGYLDAKLVQGSGITLTENNDGGNETLTIANSSPNATHTGQVTGSTALALDVTSITAQPASGVIIGTDTILINDGGVLSESTFAQMDTYFYSSLGFLTGLTVGNSTFIDLSNVGTAQVPDITATLSATGTTDATTFLRGDNTWAVPAGGGGGGGFSGLGLWRYRTATTSTPSSGQLQFDNTTIDSATELYVNITNDTGTDMSTFLSLITSGSLIYIQVQSDSTQFVVVEVDTSSLSAGVYTFQIISIEAQGTSPSNNTSVAMVTSSTGAGGSDIEVEDEGITLTTAVTKFNFVGAGVTASEPTFDEIRVTIPGSAGTIPGLVTTTINGQPMLTLEDSTRANKILSVGEQNLVWSENKISNQDWIEIGNAKDAETGYIADFDGTVVYVSAHCEDTGFGAKELRLYLDAVDTASLGTLTGGGNATINTTTLNIDFTQGQRLRVRAIDGTAGDIQDTVIKLTVKWRG